MKQDHACNFKYDSIMKSSDCPTVLRVKYCRNKHRRNGILLNNCGEIRRSSRFCSNQLLAFCKAWCIGMRRGWWRQWRRGESRFLQDLFIISASTPYATNIFLQSFDSIFTCASPQPPDLDPTNIIAGCLNLVEVKFFLKSDVMDLIISSEKQTRSLMFCFLKHCFKLIFAFLLLFLPILFLFFF